VFRGKKAATVWSSVGISSGNLSDFHGFEKEFVKIRIVKYYFHLHNSVLVPDNFYILTVI